MLGHASVATTLRLYAYVTHASTEALVDAIDARYGSRLRVLSEEVLAQYWPSETELGSTAHTSPPLGQARRMNVHLDAEPAGQLDLVWAQAEDVARLARQLCGHPEDAEDVAQSSLVKAAEHIAGFRGEATVRTWLHRITTNECRMLRRRLMATSLDGLLEEHPGNAELLLLSAADADPEALAERRTLGNAVLAAVAALPERQRVAFVLHEGGALGISEVARRLDTTVPAVRSLLVRARRAIRAEVGAIQ
jgi:RNA polymerase sigma factor (sigma-70 family)